MDAAQLPKPVDLLIVGAGPAGLFAAFYAGLRGMSVKLLDSLEILGGQLATLYPEKYIYDVPGFPKVLAKDLVAGLVQQAIQSRPTICLGEQVQTLDQTAGGEYQVTTSKAVHLARAVLIAGGVGAFTPKRLPLPNARTYEGRGLHYFVQDVNALRDQRVLIVGGGDSAVDWANTLAPFARRVTVVHRREQFRAHEQSVRQMRRTVADVRVPYELKAIGGEDRVRWATIYHNKMKEEFTVDVDVVLVNIGFESSLGPIRGWGLETEGGQIRVNETMRTSRPGVFAAGDIATHPGKLKLIATGFGEAAIAVNFAKQYLDPAANAFPGHSTNLLAKK